MPSFLPGGTHIQITAAGKCNCRRQSNGQGLCGVLKAGGGVYNLAHVYFQGSLLLIASNLGCRPARSFRPFYMKLNVQIKAERGCEWAGCHVAGATAGCLPTGTDAAAGAVVGKHTCHF